MVRDVYIVAGCRTPIGNFLGQFSRIPAIELGATVIQHCVKRSGLSSKDVNQVIMGQTLTAGQGQNPARQASVKAGIPTNVPAYTVNMLCGSGLKSVYLAWQAIVCGDAEIIVAGGQENMTQAQHSANIRLGNKYGNVQFTDTLQFDGLTDAFHNIPMGLTAEHLVEKFQVTRLEQDEYAMESQMKTQLAIESSHFMYEIVPVLTKKLPVVEFMADEFPKPNSSLEKLSLLKPAFKDGGTVTSGNSSGINDGAAAVVLCTDSIVKQKQLKPLVKIIGFEEIGIDPLEMGLGPVIAVNKLLKKISWTNEDVDLYEINEAFAVQSILCAKMLNIPKNKLNVNGGALALGHPIGASGARCLVTLIYNLLKLKKRRGIATLCVGGGMGIAIAVETCNE